ncbi:hypothetical protein P153DRAFT_349065 [Dothidotthia symphoricarpi CBS 119687]|uniref:N-acetyltransferase domain-containing protein n=1 Tax=Dothidotthia symphoricarpi CBS 119687 TaxID=1392245 RepID=A0A6A6A2I6_9PLEO|nr:uncharacterized protein P153DRAFT_349065 [Dothidotthia symphoricarpi CBS 119687]KAF2124948.1 hypothetical protein P153DRAFT_349065 [Dothidotthia symphoricarpi CBS 119687]
MASPPPTSAQYTVLRLPTTSPHVPALIKKMRDKKLAALEADPTSFILQHAVEAAHPDSVWHSRFVNSTTLVCIRTPDSTLSAEEALMIGEWAGFAAIRGPLAYSAYYFPEMGHKIPDDWAVEARWHLFDLYTFPSHRGQGVASKLVAACVATAAELTAGEVAKVEDGGRKERARVQLYCKPNDWLVGLYKRLGFRESGKVTLKEGFVTNGMEQSIPEDTGSTEELKEKWETRFGVAMERVVDIF